MRQEKIFYEQKLAFASVEIIGLKKYRVNTGIFSVFHTILMYKSLFDFFNNFLSTYQGEIALIFDDSKTIYNSF